MLPPERPDRIQIAFDDHRLVANAGLILPVTLAQRLGLSQLVDRHVDLGRTPGRANTGDKMMTLVASALAGGDCIDDADVLRTGGTAGAIGCVVKAPSTLGTFLRSFRWGHVRQLDRVSRELLAIAAGTGDVLMARLREGRANTARPAAHFLRETVGRVRHAGARGQLTVRADSGFYAHAIVAVCRKMDVRFSITVRQHQSLRQLIEAIPEEDWTPIPYWMDGAADVAETTYTPFDTKPDAAPVRLIVRRVQPTPGSQLALFTNYSYHAFITDREGDTLDLEADHRRHAEIENAIRDLKYGVGLNHLPSGRFPANGAWLAVQVVATTWPAGPPASVSVSNWSPPRPCGGVSSPWPDGSPARPAASPCIFPKAGLGKPSSVAPWRDCAPCHSLPDRVRPVRWTTEPPGRFAPGRSLSVSCGTLAADLARRRRCGPSISPLHDCHTLQPARSYRGQSLTLPFPRLSSLVRPASLHPFGGFGLRLVGACSGGPFPPEMQGGEGEGDDGCQADPWRCLDGQEDGPGEQGSVWRYVPHGQRQVYLVGFEARGQCAGGGGGDDYWCTGRLHGRT